MSTAREFSEVGHCGGKLTVTVSTIEGGKKAYQIGVRNSAPTPAGWTMLYADSDGNPLSFVPIGGLSDDTGPKSAPGILVILGSDIETLYGHECPRCHEYWRTDGFPARWATTCPYCGLQAAPHYFLTKGQRNYITECCKLVLEAMDGADGEHEVDLDAVADTVAKGSEKPKFYYANQAQQYRYKCEACGSRQDILGTYGFCSSCGTRNDAAVVRARLDGILERLAAGENPVSALKDAVAEFDSASRAIAKRLAAMVMMKPGRKTELERKVFHNPKKRAEELRQWFDIDIFKGMKPQQVSLVVKMFARRHVHEHNGGEADQKYIDDTGDTSVKVKQSLRESREEVQQFVPLVGQMVENFHAQFHEIFPPNPKPISYHRPRRNPGSPTKP